MKLIYLKSALKYNSFDVAINIKIQFFRVLVTIEPGRSLLQFVTTNCLKHRDWMSWSHRFQTVGSLLFPENIIDAGVEHTNRKIDHWRAKFPVNLLDKQIHSKPIDLAELGTFFGLVYLNGVLKSGNEYTIGLFPSNGTERVIFRLIMSLNSFLYIEACLCLGDPTTHQARQTPLAPTFDIDAQFIGKCKQL